MIDINKIKSGDCLLRVKDNIITACFVLFPNMEYNVCVRHAFECTHRRIRVLNNLQQAPSDLEEYCIISFLEFHSLAFIANSAIHKSFDLVNKTPTDYKPLFESMVFQRYQLINGDYFIVPCNPKNKSWLRIFYVSGTELSWTDQPPQDWQTKWATISYIQPSAYISLKIHADTYISLFQSKAQKIMRNMRNGEGR